MVSGPPRGMHEGCGGTFRVSYTRKDLVCNRCGAVAPYKDRPGKAEWTQAVGSMAVPTYGPEPPPRRRRTYGQPTHGQLTRTRRSRARPVALAMTLVAVAVLGAVWYFDMDPTDVGHVILDGLGEATKHGGAALEGAADLADEGSTVLSGLGDAARDAAATVGESAPEARPEAEPVTEPVRGPTAESVVESARAYVLDSITKTPDDVIVAQPTPLDRTIYPDGTTHGAVADAEQTWPDTEPRQENAGLIEEYIHTIVNQHRAAAGLVPLERDAELDTIARTHSQDMADRNYYDHDTPEGLDPSDRARVAGYECIKDRYGGQHFNRHSYYMSGIAENIHSVYGEWYSNPMQMANLLMDGQGRQMGWMDSTGHRQNILHADHTRIGIGVAFNGMGDIYATQNFC